MYIFQLKLWTTEKRLWSISRKLKVFECKHFDHRVWARHRAQSLTLYLNLYNASISSNGAVTRVRNLPFNNDQYSVMHTTLSKDRSRLYFSSNMSGGLGGFDLYYVRIQQNNKYSKPINLGPGINTEGNEVFPFIHRNDVLFFASDAHPGLGGLDIFLATGLGTESQDVENMGAPFNSSKDDFSLFLDKNFKYGFLSSNRSGGKGEDDIYSFKINIYL